MIAYSRKDHPNDIILVQDDLIQRKSQCALQDVNHAQ